MAERPSHQSENALRDIAASFQTLRQPIFSGDDAFDAYSRYYMTNTGARVSRLVRQLPELVTNPQAVSEFNTRLLKNTELARDILRGVESPKQELREEMKYLTERLSVLVPQTQQDASLRRRDQKEVAFQQTNAFGEGMVSLLEEIINGKDEKGNNTQAVIFHRIARIALSQLSPEVMRLVFEKSQDGRLYFSRTEVGAVTNLREKKAVSTAINIATGGLLKEGEEPVSAYRGVKAVAGKIGRGLLATYIRLDAGDETTRKKAAHAQKWLIDHDSVFDPQIAKGLGWGEKVNSTVRQISDVLQFTQYEMPHHLSRAINAVPTNEQLTKIGDVIKATVAMGVTGLSPLLELPAFQKTSK